MWQPRGLHCKFWQLRASLQVLAAKGCTAVLAAREGAADLGSCVDCTADVAAEGCAAVMAAEGCAAVMAARGCIR